MAQFPKAEADLAVSAVMAGAARMAEAALAVGSAGSVVVWAADSVEVEQVAVGR